MLPRMRTIAETHKYLQKSDPDTAMNPYALRRLILTNAIPFVKSGNKYLINLDLLEDYLSTPHETDREITQHTGGIYKIQERI